MRVNILPGTRFHSTQLIQKLSELKCDVKVFSSSPRKNFKTDAVFSYQFVPQLAVILERLLKKDLTFFELYQNKLYDHLCRFLMRDCDVLHGWAGLSLSSGIKAKKYGGIYLLERSCPHLLFQEELLARESEKLKLAYQPKPDWWVERSMREYEEADYIITPSEYTRKTFLDRGVSPKKIRKIPLDKNISVKIPIRKFRGSQLTFGTIVGNPLRKGLVYLLEAWENLQLVNSKLIIKMNPIQLEGFPVLKALILRQPSIEVRGYYPRISDFYHECDAFILPSVDDGFGLVVTEALAHGLPCIATDHVGAIENFKGLSFVRVAKAGDSESLGNEIEKLCENPDELPSLRDAILKYFCENDTHQSGYERGIEDLYQPLLNQTRSLFSQTDSLANPS